MEEVWTREFSVGDLTFEATFIRRPFREGLEVQVEVDGELIRVAEFGFGEQSLLEKLRTQVEQSLHNRTNSR